MTREKIIAGKLQPKWLLHAPQFWCDNCRVFPLRATPQFRSYLICLTSLAVVTVCAVWCAWVVWCEWLDSRLWLTPASHLSYIAGILNELLLLVSALPFSADACYVASYPSCYVAWYLSCRAQMLRGWFCRCQLESPIESTIQPTGMMGHSTGDPHSPTNRQPDPPPLPFTPFTTHAATALSFPVAVSFGFWVAGPTMVGLFATRIPPSSTSSSPPGGP